MAEKPKMVLDELLKEAELTAEKYLIVEGATDKGFYREWLLKMLGEGRTRDLTVESVDALSFDQTRVDDLGLNKGARSSVIYVATEAASRKVNIKCIADRDAGHQVERFNVDPLLWTDYPALESYVFYEGALDALNRTVLGERLPEGSALVSTLAPVLRELFTVRMHNEHLPAPDISKGFGKSKNPEDFDVTRAVGPVVGAATMAYERPTSAEPRDYAYGHDVANVLLHVFANEIKNQAKVPHREALEVSFRLCLLISGGFDASGLAKALIAWCSSE